MLSGITLLLGGHHGGPSKQRASGGGGGGYISKISSMAKSVQSGKGLGSVTGWASKVGGNSVGKWRCGMNDEISHMCTGCWIEVHVWI